MIICTDRPAGEPSDNLKVLGEYSDAMAEGRTEAVFDFWASNFESHVTERVSPGAVGSDVRGEEQVYWDQARAAFPDMEFTVGVLVECGDIVVSNWTITGTHTGAPFYDLQPSGERVTINGTAVLRLEDGKIVEHWGGPHCPDGLGVKGARAS
jgi:predicted ester cyclase